MKTNSPLAKAFARFRAAGCPANHAIHAAKTWLRFLELEAQELVRLGTEEEQERYLDVYGDPDGYTDQHGRRVSAKQARAELVALLDRLGVWVVFSECWDGKEWKVVDSVGMCSGYVHPSSPFENWYVPDLMRAAVDEAERRLAELETEQAEAHDAACRDVATV